MTTLAHGSNYQGLLEHISRTYPISQMPSDLLGWIHYLRQNFVPRLVALLLFSTDLNRRQW